MKEKLALIYICVTKERNSYHAHAAIQNASRIKKCSPYRR